MTTASLWQALGKMAARCVATLKDVPVNFGLSYMKDVEISLKSQQTGYRYFSEGYFYKITLHWSKTSEDTLCIGASCYRSQRKSQVGHGLSLDIGLKAEKVVDVYCSCQAGQSGACSHIVGLIIAIQQWRLMGFTEVPGHTSVTSLPQQWGVPRGPKIEPVAAPGLQIVNPKPSRKRQPVRNEVKDNRKRKINDGDIQNLQRMGLPISYLVSKPDKTIETQYGAVTVASGLATQAKFFTTTRPTPVGTTCGNLVFPQEAKVSLSDVRTHTVKAIDQLTCQSIEEKTREQAASPLWFSEREGRLTASNFHSIITRQKINNEFIKSLICPKPFNSAATSYGKANESKAIKMYIEKTCNHVHQCGLVVNPKFPFLGGSPDGKVCDSGKTGLLEVKCPFSARNVTIKEALNIKNFCLQEKESIISLKENHAYYFQVQGQMMVSGLDFCDFVVYTSKDFFIQRISFNNDFAQTMLDKLTKFYHDHMLKYMKENDSSNIS